MLRVCLTGMTVDVTGSPQSALAVLSIGHRPSIRAHRILTIAFFATLAVFTGPPCVTAAQDTVRIAVFEFELNDTSAGGGIVPEDAIDTRNLKLATEEARSMLAASGRYSIVDPGSRASEIASVRGIRHCNGCEAALAAELGADRSMAGIVTRVSRTEYTLQIVVRDAGTGAILSNAFTGLRMGANYAWPRGARWLISNRILSAQHAE